MTPRESYHAALEGDMLTLELAARVYRAQLESLPQTTTVMVELAQVRGVLCVFEAVGAR